MAHSPTPRNFRAEMGRHGLTRRALAGLIKMHPSLLSQLLTEGKPLRGWMAHNIGFGLNVLSNRRLFEVDEALGLLPAPPPGRTPSEPKEERVTPTPLLKPRRVRKAPYIRRQRASEQQSQNLQGSV